MPGTAAAPRMLLCACPLHCAQVLRLAGHTHVRLHGLQASTNWPTPSAPGSTATPNTNLYIWWALLPANAPPAARAREQAWRQQLPQLTGTANAPPATITVQMLYGNAAQQAQQLTPWIHDSQATTSAPLALADCQECLDARSEQQLFSRLLDP